jgi:DNA-binding NtrC family response regulator
MFLPKVDGWTLFLHVRKRHPKVPFVFVTAIDDFSVRESAMREGAADYLLKPFTCEEFLTTVRRVLGHQAA